MSLPLHVELLARHMKPWANVIAQRYGYPVYLVGSALTTGAAARDVDVVVIMPWDEYISRFDHRIAGVRSEARDREKRLQAELGKMSSNAAKFLGLNVDLKIETDAEAGRWEYLRNRLRIDDLPFEEVESMVVCPQHVEPYGPPVPKHGLSLEILDSEYQIERVWHRGNRSLRAYVTPAMAYVHGFSDNFLCFAKPVKYGSGKIDVSLAREAWSWLCFGDPSRG